MLARRHLPLLAVAVALLLPGSATAATFTPTTTADGDDPICAPNACTLRDAIEDAGAAPGNEVSIPAGTYTLSLGELLIDNDMTVTGAGARTTIIDAQGTSRVFSIDTGSAVTIRGVTITGGDAPPPGPGFGAEGGGILTDGSLTLESSAVVGNTAQFTGGGISSPFKGDESLTTIRDSLIANNTVTGGLAAGSGGGLNLFGDGLVVNSTVTGNSVSNPGYNQGGGITNARNSFSPSPGELTLLNSTVAGNSIDATGGGLGAGISGDDVQDFMGALVTDFRSTNSIVAGNTGGTDCALVNTTVTNFNLSGDASCGFNDAGSKQNANPQLGALADNGGPTNTRALADGSPALNSGTGTGCPAADQRGTARPQALRCDMGAFELGAPDLVVTLRPGTAKTEGRAVYIATIANKGPQSALGARLKSKVPAETGMVRLKGCKHTKKRPNKTATNTHRKKYGCPLGRIAPGASVEVTINFEPKRKGRLVTKAKGRNDLGDADPSNNTAKAKIVRE